MTIDRPPGTRSRLSARLNVFGSGGFIKFNSAAERAVIGNRHRRHAGLFDVRDEIRDLGQPVEQTILGVIVQMHVITWL